MSEDFKLTQRKSPEDYFDGLVAGLKAARDAIEKSLKSAEEAREIAKTMALRRVASALT